MYNWMKDKKISGLRSFSASNFTPNNFNNLVKNSFESISYKQLPVIKEEEVIISKKDNKSKLPENFLSKTLKNKCPRKKTVYMDDLKDNYENREQVRNVKDYMKLPPLTNINCLMNTDIKQSHHIWDTNFGRRLMQGKNDDLINVNNKTLFAEKRFSCTKTRVFEKPACQASKFMSRSRSVTEPNVKNRRRDRADESNQKKISRKKLKKISKLSQNLPTQSCQWKKTLNNITVLEAKSSVRVMQSSTKEKEDKMLLKQVLKVSSSKEDTQEIVPTISSFSKNRHLLTESVRNILDCTLNQFECKHCKDHFPNIEDLCQHKKQHESKKEICLLCKKMFYDPYEFVQHLLSHEDVDQFSCKKCKKYFPNLKKYKQHCQDFHLMPEKDSNQRCQTTLEFVRKWLPKYECKRCQMRFESERAQEEHKRNHIKSDLAGAYLLSPKYM